MGTLRIGVATSYEAGYGEKALKNQTRGLWTAPTYIGFGAPVPAAPDYSTPKAVNARIREFCGKPWLATTDTSFKKAWKAFRAVVPTMACRVEDTHGPRWEYRVAPATYKYLERIERRAYGKPDAAWEAIEVEAAEAA